MVFSKNGRILTLFNISSRIKLIQKFEQIAFGHIKCDKFNTRFSTMLCIQLVVKELNNANVI